MHITVNGKRWEVTEGLTLRDVVAQLGARPEHVAIEHNGDIVPVSDLGNRVLSASDRLEVVHFVGGG